MKPIALAIAIVSTAAAYGQMIFSPEPKLRLGKPVQVGTLAVVPILSSRPLGFEKYMTLAQAVKMGAVEIVEIPGRETVNSLEVRNKAKLPLILFAGELLLGGKQDRIVGKDTIVLPGESAHVPVFCVEHGRWSGTDKKFKGGDTFVPYNVREAAFDGQGQSKVWSEVARSNSQVGAAPSTQTIQGSLNRADIRAQSDKFFSKLLTANWKGAVGAVCWMNGEVHSADIFGGEELFSASKDKLLRSYALEAAMLKDPKIVPVDIKACLAFLQEVGSAKRGLGDKDANGAMYRVRNGKVTGYESGGKSYGGGFGGGGYGHGSYRPGKGGG